MTPEDGAKRGTSAKCCRSSFTYEELPHAVREALKGVIAMTRPRCVAASRAPPASFSSTARSASSIPSAGQQVSLGIGGGIVSTTTTIFTPISESATPFNGGAGAL
jgi:hypothetical protein